MTTAEQGRAALAKWKAEHAQCTAGTGICGCGKCKECSGGWPCPTARLIAAAEILTGDSFYATEKERRDAALAHLAEPSE